jgi:hypothetical protein
VHTSWVRNKISHSALVQCFPEGRFPGIGLMALNRETLGQAESLDGSDRVVLDMDSSESPVTVAAGKAKWKSRLAFARPSPLYPAQKVG